MEDKVKKLMPDILELAKKLPKGSKMEIEMPEKGKKKDSDSDSDDEMCPHCGAPMAEKPLSGKELREKLKG